jgi:uncharacterized protein (TIRG00374 family)
MKKRLFTIIRVIVSLSLIIVLLYIMRDKYGQIIAAYKQANLSAFAAGLLIFIAAIAIASVRLKMIIEAQEIPIRLIEALSLTFIGYFFNNFLPTAIGGDMVKAYYLSKKTDNKMGAFASIFVDRLMGLVTMVFMAFVALFFVPDNIIDPSVRVIIYGITAGSVLIILFMVNKRFARLFSFFLVFLRPIKERLAHAYETIHKYREHTPLMVKSFLISIVSQVFFFASLAMLTISIGKILPIREIFLRMPIVSMLSLLPSINGLGLREGATVVFFGPLIGKGNAFAVSILWLAVLFIVSIMGGIIYALSPQFKVRLKEIEKIEEEVSAI